MRHGFDFDFALQMPDLLRTALCIISSEQRGAKFDWVAMEWVDEK